MAPKFSAARPTTRSSPTWAASSTWAAFAPQARQPARPRRPGPQKHPRHCPADSGSAAGQNRRSGPDGSRPTFLIPTTSSACGLRPAARLLRAINTGGTPTHIGQLRAGVAHGHAPDQRSHQPHRQPRTPGTPVRLTAGRRCSPTTTCRTRSWACTWLITRRATAAPKPAARPTTARPYPAWARCASRRSRWPALLGLPAAGFDFRNGAAGLSGLAGSARGNGHGPGPHCPRLRRVPAAPGKPRSVDLLPIFHTGVPNLPPYQLATGKNGNPLAAGKPFINNFLCPPSATCCA